MKIAIPTTAGELSAHFGHCETFAVCTIENDKIAHEEMINPPAHEPGSHPKFLHDLGVTVVISGGMGMKAQQLMQENGIQVITGTCQLPLKELVEVYLKDGLQSGNNPCDH